LVESFEPSHTYHLQGAVRDADPATYAINLKGRGALKARAQVAGNYLPNGSSRTCLDRLSNRLTKIISEVRQLHTP